MLKKSLVVLFSILFFQLPAYAWRTFDALCNDKDCVVTFTSRLLKAGELEIPIDRLIEWTYLNKTNYRKECYLFFGCQTYRNKIWDAERYDFSISYYTPKGDKENVIISFTNENPMVSFKQDLQLWANGKSAVKPELEPADMKDSFFKDTPNPNFKVGLQDWTSLVSNYREYDFKYSPKDTIEQGRFINFQVLQSRVNDKSYYFIMSIRLDCQSLLSSFYFIDAPPEYRQYLNTWFKPSPLAPEGPNSTLAKMYCKK